jgi:hypothetical protein
VVKLTFALGIGGEGGVYGAALNERVHDQVESRGLEVGRKGEKQSYEHRYNVRGSDSEFVYRLQQDSK